jgi:hypothetical protein
VGFPAQKAKQNPVTLTVKSHGKISSSKEKGSGEL